MSDLVKRLREYQVPRRDPDYPYWETPDVCEEAADRIDALEAENARLRGLVEDQAGRIEWTIWPEIMTTTRDRYYEWAELARTALKGDT